MAVNIGPRIGIDGESEYRSQMMNIIQQTKTLKAEMKSLSGEYDSNGKKIKSLKDKMAQAEAKAKNLNDQIKVQKEKVEQTANMVAEASRKYGDADTRTLQWKEALANANAELSRMQGELDAIPSKTSMVGQAMQEAGAKIKAVGESIKQFGDNMTKKITAPIVAAGGLALKAFNEVDAGYDAVIKKTGATGEELEEMQGIVDDIATSVPTDFETVGEAVGEVNTRFGATGDELESLSKQFIEFADLNDTDVTTSIDSVQSAMAAWGLESSDTGAYLDTLNAVAQQTGADAVKLADDMVTNASSLKEMGFSASDAATFLGKLDTQGLDSQTVMAGLKKALANAAAEGKPMNEALEDLQTAMQNADSDADAMALAIDLFGAKAGPQLATAISEGRLSLDALGTSLTDNIGSVGTTFAATQDPIDQWKTTLNSLKLAAASIGATLGTVLVPIMETVKNVVMTLKEKWDALSPSTQEAIVKAALIAAAIGPVISVVGRLTSGVGSLIGGVGGIIGKIGSFSAILSPTTLIIAAVVAAIVAIIAVIKNWGAIVDWIKGVWENLKTTISNVWNNIKSTVSNAMNAVKTTITTAWTNVKTTISNAVTGAYNTVVSKFNAIKTKISSVMTSAKTAVSNAITKIKGLFNFEWSLPKLKMPHFSISGGFSLHPLSMPHISVSWYKKAYSNPVMFKSPTVLATSAGVKGFGDGSGGEIVIGQSMMYDLIKSAVADANGGGNYQVIVNAAPGMDEEQIGTIAARKIYEMTQGRRAVYA